MTDYTAILRRAMPLCSACRATVTTCARCGGPLYAGDQVRCDPDEGMPRHMHEWECPVSVAELNAGLK